ncbi:hypothetical protein [Carboxylicivirga sp. RSCT41]|uniref:hypothetical protein n=1 Tax=Carboxylicivirga agarovorans TaxID=3417570 RepID=UPI003D33FA58
MTKSENTRYYSIGGIRFKVNFLSPFFVFDKQGGSHLFQETEISKQVTWTLNFRSDDEKTPENWEQVFKGSEKFKEDLPYKWSIIKKGALEGIYVCFEDNEIIKETVAFVDIDKKLIDIRINTGNNNKVTFDPFFHPFGILLLQYIVHYYGGFVIHASTINYKDKGYLFSAVSGTGKSTMAGLWYKYGATVINDDRLIILPDNGTYKAYNTPMPYYQDRSKEVKIHKLFLIKQSPDNYLKKLPVLKGALGLMSNCMQFQYNKEQVQNRLNALIDLSETCGIYECGFKPDTEIIDYILNEFGQ